VKAGAPGVFSTGITPFDRDGKLDEGALRAHLQYQANGGAGVYLASGGTGEAHLMRPEERRRVYEIGVEVLKGKVPAYAAGIGFTDTELIIREAKEAASIGVDAVVIMPPSPGNKGIKPTRKELEQFYVDILEQVHTPVFLYNQFYLVEYQVPIEIFDRLLDTYGQIAGVHNTDLDLTYLVRLIDTVGGRAPVHVGFFGQLFTNLQLGGQGALCYEPNIAPRLCTSIYERFRAGDLAGAGEAFTRLLRLNAVLMKYQNPRAIKAAVNLLGLPGGYPRRPYLDVDEEGQREIARVLEGLEIARAEGLG
jgi:4-hydroxy-tetrahydrodipicolinate synthase